MTRHDLSQHHAAGAPPPATDPRASMMTVATDMVVTSRVRGQLNRAKAQRSGLSTSTSTLPSVGPADADIGRTSKSP